MSVHRGGGPALGGACSWGACSQEGPAPRGMPALGVPAPAGCLLWGVPALGGGGVWSGGPGGDPPDGYCCRWYAPYWNAFLSLQLIHGATPADPLVVNYFYHILFQADVGDQHWDMNTGITLALIFVVPFFKI